MKYDATLPPRSEMLRAFLASDSAFEGLFYTAVKTTGVFCRPTCTARKPKPENVEFYRTPDDAMAAGFRPCKRCTPLDSDPAEAPAWMRELFAELDHQPAARWSDEDLAARGLDTVQLRRWCKKHFGMTFHAYVRSRRLGLALGSLRAGEAIDAAAFDAGYESLSGFREGFRKTFGVAPGRARNAEVLHFTRLTTPLGPMIAMAERRGLVMLEFLDRPALAKEIEDLRGVYGYAIAPGSNPHLAQLERELAAYFAGELRNFTVALQMCGTPFELAVWNQLLLIPMGETRSYAQIAAELGKPNACRAVGLANGRNRMAIVMPCHRVIGADGSLTGYGGGMPRKQFLLDLERDAVQGSRQLRFATQEERA